MFKTIRTKVFKRFSTVKSNSRKGFTLVELIVVIAIMAILALIGGIRFSAYIEKAETARIQADMRTIYTATQLVVQTTGKADVAEISKLSNMEVKDVYSSSAGVEDYRVATDGGPNGDEIYIVLSTKDNMTYVYDSDGPHPPSASPN